MRALRACVLFLVLVAIVAGCGGAGGGGGGGGGAVQRPPVGVVWFGTAMDPGTLALTGQSNQIKAGSPIFAVGSFLNASAPEDLVVQIQLLGSEIARLPLPAGSPNSAFGIDLSGQNLRPGSYLVNFVNKNRRTLAAGNLTVTP